MQKLHLQTSEELKKVIEMGMKEGITMTLDNLERVVTS